MSQPSPTCQISSVLGLTVITDLFLVTTHNPKMRSNKLAICTTNKVCYQLFIRQCEILQSTPLKELDNPIGTTGQPVRPALIPNITVWLNLPDIVRFRPYCPRGFVFGDNAWPKNASNKLTINTTNKASYQFFIC